MGYTKGEWRASPVRKSGATISIQIGVGSCDWGIGDFSRVLPNNRQDSQVEETHVANARLIAASPRMARLLERLVNDGWNAGVTEEAQEILDTIPAKADGKE